MIVITIYIERRENIIINKQEASRPDSSAV